MGPAGLELWSGELLRCRISATLYGDAVSDELHLLVWIDNVSGCQYRVVKLRILDKQTDMDNGNGYAFE